MTHASIPPEVRARSGIADSLVRLPVGVEDAADLIADLEQALAWSLLSGDGCRHPPPHPRAQIFVAQP